MGNLEITPEAEITKMGEEDYMESYLCDTYDVVMDLNDSRWDHDNCNNVTTKEPYYDNNFEKLASILVPTLFSIITTVGSAGNLLVILVVTLNRQMRTTTNLLIISLAVADLLFVIFCVPFTALRYVMSVWPLGRIWCKLYQYLIQVSVYVSVYTLVLMSVDRYLAVVHPVKSISMRTEKNTSIAVLLLWVIVALLNLYIPLEYDVKQYGYPGEARSDCVNVYVYNQHMNDEEPSHALYLHVTFFVLGYALPLTLTCLLYGNMLRHFLRGVSPGINNQSASRILSKRRVTRMVIIVVVVFASCWLPIHCVFLMLYVGQAPQTHTMVTIQMWFTCLAYLNSCLNPILYAFVSDNFRKCFFRLLCCRLMGVQRGYSITGSRLENNLMEMIPGARLRSSLTQRTSSTVVRGSRSVVGGTIFQLLVGSRGSANNRHQSTVLVQNSINTNLL